MAHIKLQISMAHVTRCQSLYILSLDAARKAAYMERAKRRRLYTQSRRNQHRREKRAAQTVSDWEAYNVMSKNQFERLHFLLQGNLKLKVAKLMTMMEKIVTNLILETCGNVL